MGLILLIIGLAVGFTIGFILNCQPGWKELLSLRTSIKLYQQVFGKYPDDDLKKFLDPSCIDKPRPAVDWSSDQPIEVTYTPVQHKRIAPDQWQWKAEE